MEALVEKYQHPILKKYGEMAKERIRMFLWIIKELRQMLFLNH